MDHILFSSCKLHMYTSKESSSSFYMYTVTHLSSSVCMVAFRKQDLNGNCLKTHESLICLRRIRGEAGGTPRAVTKLSPFELSCNKATGANPKIASHSSASTPTPNSPVNILRNPTSLRGRWKMNSFIYNVLINSQHVLWMLLCMHTLYRYERISNPRWLVNRRKAQTPRPIVRSQILIAYSA